MLQIKARDILSLSYGDKFEFDENTVVICPSCNEKVKISDFKETEVPCELCGEHYAIECPKCKNDFDITLCEEIFTIPE